MWTNAITTHLGCAEKPDLWNLNPRVVEVQPQNPHDGLPDLVVVGLDITVEHAGVPCPKALTGGTLPGLSAEHPLTSRIRTRSPAATGR